MMRYLFLIFSICLATHSVAQVKPAYTVGVEAGIVKGNYESSQLFTLTNGIAYKNAMAGIGVGIDYYLFRSIPLFADVRKSFGNHRVQPFINAVAGINITYPAKDQKTAYFWYNDADFKNGFFVKAAAGASIKMDKKFRVAVSAGYSYKTNKVAYGTAYSPTDIIVNANTDIYRLNRWILTAGIWF